ncbi:divalent-cation tolerance protein CutA [Thalassotalea aquiviva]|uniref:divalent-cation tolerance protein CutA n=1 Tax=Thalassotalea aquiviva TaxID=3242415 RepID=UPI00352BCE60
MYHLVLTNCPDQQSAHKIANGLVAKQLAACVNIVPKIQSVYQWQGEIHCDNEVQLLIKSKASLYLRIEQYIMDNHPYDVPEVIALNIQQGSKAYLNWINDTVVDT